MPLQLSMRRLTVESARPNVNRMLLRNWNVLKNTPPRWEKSETFADDSVKHVGSGTVKGFAGHFHPAKGPAVAGAERPKPYHLKKEILLLQTAASGLTLLRLFAFSTFYFKYFCVLSYSCTFDIFSR